MAAVWGRAEIDIDADGSDLPRQVRAIASKAGNVGGKAMGDSFTKSFNQRLREGLRRAFDRIGGFFKGAWSRLFRRGGQSVGDGFSEGFQNSMKNFRLIFDNEMKEIEKRSTDIDLFSGMSSDLERIGTDVERAGRSFRGFFRELEGNKDIDLFHSDVLEDIGEFIVLTEDAADGVHRMGESAGGASRNMRAFTDSNNDSNESMGRTRSILGSLRGLLIGSGGRWRDLADAVNGADDSNKKFNAGHRRLSHGFRQAIFWVGLFTASLAQLSGLGSAVAGTLIALSTAALGLAAGVGFAVVGFANLFSESAKLTPQLEAAKKAFVDLGDVFKGFGKIIMENMFGPELTDSVNRFAGAIKSLEGPIAAFAAQVGKTLAAAFDTLANPAVLQGFATLLEGFAPIFDAMVRAALDFGGAIGSILIASLPTAQAFADAIARVADEFARWAESEEGRDRLAVFFDTAERIMPKVVDLFAAAGGALAGIVTEETLTGLEQFIDSLTASMDGVEELLEVFGNLNVFGLLAGALDSILQILEPLWGPLQNLATALNGMIQNILPVITPLFVALAEAIAPLIDLLADMAEWIGQNAEWIVPLAVAIAGIVGAMALFVNGAMILIGIIEAVINIINLARVAWFLLSLAFELSPIGLIITAIVALVAALIWFFTQTELGKEVWANIVEFIQNAVKWIGEAIGNIGQWFADVWAAVIDGVDAFFGWWNGVWAGFAQVVSDILANIGQFFVDVWNNIIAFFTGIFNWWVGFWTAFLTPILNFLQPMFDAFATAFQGIVLIVQGVFNIIWGIIQIFIAVVSLAFQAIAQFFIDLWAQISQIFIDAWNGIVAFITPIVESIVAFFTTVFEAVATWWNDLWTSISQWFQDVWNGIVAFFSPIITGIVNFFQGIFNGIANWWKGIWDGVKNTFTNIWNAISGFVSSVINGISSAIQGVWNGFLGFWSGLWNGVSSIFKGIWNGIESFIRGVVNNIIGIINGIISGINSVGSAFGVSVPKIPKMARGGVAWNSMLANIGEAGPEAVVPLRRPLSQVDPSVRALSAIAQGKMGLGGPSSNVTDKRVNIEPGAVVINGSINPERTALSVVNRLAERIAG